MPIEDLVADGVLALIGLTILFGIVQAALSYFAQRSLQDLHNQGMQAIIATNEMMIVDEAMERRGGNKSQ